MDKATIVKAVEFDEQGKELSEYQSVYFVGYEQKEGYDSLKVISVSCNPDDLFGYDRGIYVCGRTFDEHIASLDDIKSFSHWSYKANFFIKGNEVRREASVSFL